MLNSVTFVGRIIEDIENVKDNTHILKVAVNRVVKDESGEYKTDIIPVIIDIQFYNNMSSAYSIGDMCGIKGRLEVKDHHLVVIGEKMTFCATKKEEE